jgi:hypothetical protein
MLPEEILGLGLVIRALCLQVGVHPDQEPEPMLILRIIFIRLIWQRAFIALKLGVPVEVTEDRGVGVLITKEMAGAPVNGVVQTLVWVAIA